MNSDSKLKELMVQVKAINNKYENILAVTGEEFNVFRILKMEANETKLHSMFLSELLNPKGTHGQKDTFLKIFIESFVNEDVPFFTEDANVIPEKHIGFTNEDKTEGGRIDIYIDDLKGHRIFIENKIYAPDQENQMLRYHNFDPKASLFYLNLEGGEVKEYSKKELIQGKDFQVITYKTDIIKWLEECRKEAVSHPLLRESITQYIHLLKYLTGQTINENMKKELIDLILNDKESLNAAFTIYGVVDAACDELLEKLKLIIQEVAEELDLIGEYNINWNRNYTGFWFKHQSWKKVNITFQFTRRDRGMVYGIGRRIECAEYQTDSLTVKVYNKLEVLDNGVSNSWWPFVKPIEPPFDNWNNKEPWQAILDGSIKVWIKDKVEEILRLLDGYKL